MSQILIWCLVIFLTLLIGALLPKILQFIFRLALYVVAFFLVLFLFSKVGVVPNTWTEKAKSFFYEHVTQKKCIEEKN
jgi:hypothetical protein